MVSLIGEFNYWAKDVFPDCDPFEPDEFSKILLLICADHQDGNGIIALKVQED